MTENELEKRGLTVDCQVPIAITYQGIRFVEGLRANLIVAGKVIVELKGTLKIGTSTMQH